MKSLVEWISRQRQKTRSVLGFLLIPVFVHYVCYLPFSVFGLWINNLTKWQNVFMALIQYYVFFLPFLYKRKFYFGSIAFVVIGGAIYAVQMAYLPASSILPWVLSLLLVDLMNLAMAWLYVRYFKWSDELSVANSTSVAEEASPQGHKSL